MNTRIKDQAGCKPDAEMSTSKTATSTPHGSDVPPTKAPTTSDSLTPEAARGLLGAATSPSVATVTACADSPPQIPRFVERIKSYVELAYHILACFAIIIGALWALRAYIVQHEYLWNIDMTLSSESYQYPSQHRMVVLRVDLENRGKQPVRAGKSGLILTVVRVARDVPPDQVVRRTRTHFAAGQKTIVRELNMLRHYEENWDPARASAAPYELEPGSKRQETEAVLVTERDLLLVEVHFFGIDGDSISQYRYIYAGRADSTEQRPAPASTDCPK